MKLIVATGNAGKLREIREILSGVFDPILSLKECGLNHETVEDGKTFLENAEKKAREAVALCGEAVLADDSGLSVDALNGEPGVYSARFAGEHGDTAANNALLLEKMKGIQNRAAHFTSAMVLCFPNGKTVFAEGKFYGEIAETPRGSGGFGYDPLFYLPEYGKTVAELTEEEKNAVSHRRKALDLLLKQLSD